MRLLQACLEWLAKRAAPLLAVGLLIGIVAPDLARVFKPLLPPAVLILLLTTLLRIQWRDVLSHLRRPGRIALILVCLNIGAPLAMLAATHVLDVPDGLSRALVLMACSPVLVSVPTFALMIGLDGALALVLSIASALLQPFIQPPLALALLGVELAIGVGPLMGRLAAFVGGALVLALLVRRVAGPARIAGAAKSINGLSVLMLIVFAIGVVDGVTETLLARPGYVLKFLAAAFAANFTLQAVGVVLFGLVARTGILSWREGLTAALAMGNRNLATLVAVLGSAAEFDLFLYLAAAQFPMYLIPALIGPIYRRLLRVGA